MCSGYHQCNISGECIPPEWICDGKFHCTDKSDENRTLAKCEEKPGQNTGQLSTLCALPYLECESSRNLSHPICAQKCDGIVECKDERDEFGKESGCGATVPFNGNFIASDQLQIIAFPADPMIKPYYDNNVRVAWTISSNYSEIIFEILIYGIEGCDGEGTQACTDVLQITEGDCIHHLPKVRILRFQSMR